MVTKLNSTGTILYSTYLGGTGTDVANGIAIDSSGHAYVTGVVSSSNFPTQNPIITVGPAFLTKFSADGRTLVYSTHLQGGGAAVAVDPAGEALLAGTFSGGTAMPNVYVGKINFAGIAFVYSINFGGTGGDQGTGIATDSAGDAFVVGYTRSTDFFTRNPFQDTNKGGWDAFVTKFSASGAVVFSTYLGGSGDDFGRGIAVDLFGAVYVTGDTQSTNFPVTSNAVQKTNRGSIDAFVINFNASGQNIAYYSTYLGGSTAEHGMSLKVDSALNVYVTGWTASTNFPVTPKAFQTNNHGGVDAFIAKLVIAADLQILGGAENNPVRNGSNVTYSFAVNNLGPDTSHGGTLTDVLPSGTTFVGFSNTNGNCTHPAVGSTGTFQCTRSADLLAGHSWGPITLTIKLNEPAGTTIVTDTAHVSAKTQDLVPGNNTRQISVAVE